MGLRYALIANQPGVHYHFLLLFLALFAFDDRQERKLSCLDRRHLMLGAASVAVTNSLIGGAAKAAGTIKPDAASALIVVDVQNCFLPGGSLAVKDGDQVVPVINKIAKGFENIVLTQDWHTQKHISFASSHAGIVPRSQAPPQCGARLAEDFQKRYPRGAAPPNSVRGKG